MAVGSSAPAKPWLPNLWLIRRAHHRGCSRRFRQISASTSADSFVGLVCGRRDRSARTVTLPAADVLRGGDTRWIHRAAHDLMGVNPDATKSMAGMPCGRSLYGSIPEQLADDTSFTRQLQAILRVRSHYGIATSQQIDIPDSQRAATTTAVASSDKRGSRCFSTCCRRRARCGGRIRRSCLGLTGAGPRRGVATSH
jgi:hypothetical protein